MADNVDSSVLIAIDSMGIDPLGHDRPESVYAHSRLLFPRGRRGELIEVDAPGWEGTLVETDVTGGLERGGIECALTYTAHFTGRNAVERHGLLQGLGLNERLLKEMVAESNLFSLFPSGCLANSLFPAHLPFFGSSHAEDLVGSFSREAVEQGVRFRGTPVRLLGKEKNGFAELFTLAEINQNIFVHAAREAGVRLRTWDDVRRGQALTSSMTHELESEFDFSLFGESPLPSRTPDEAASILSELSGQHPFVFYKYQVADLVSHSGRLDLAREVFGTVERFIGALLERLDPRHTLLVVTSDHGHLEQVEYHHGHPKTKVPTWCFGPSARKRAACLSKPEAIFDLFAQLPAGERRA